MAIHTVRVTDDAATDPIGEDVLAEIRRTLGLHGIDRVRTARVYRLEGVAREDAETLARKLLADPVADRWTLDAPILPDATRTVEVAYHPGVMNPVASSILKSAADLGIRPAAVDASREYAFYGRMDEDAVRRVIARLLVNPTVEHVVTQEPETLALTGTPGSTRRIPLAGMDDAGLRALSDAGLYLALEEMRALQEHFAALERDPTDLELEVLAQTWSEHCVHKTFRSPIVVDGTPKPPLMTRLKDVARQFPDLVVSAFVDNSGVLAFYDGWAVAGKVETHNSPSAIEPYGGAMTGSGGVFRDVMGTGLGGSVIASTDMFCFAPPDLPPAEVPPGALRPDYLLRRVVAGVRDYGNRMGIPTNNGSVHFHRDFRAKPTVIVGAYGLLPEAVARKGEPEPGDRILALGGRTGRDGIHGATFSSTAMTSDTIDVNAQAVQIGNAIEEKRLLDAVVACREAGRIRAIQDCGAGGFSSAIGEMGKDIGATVDLERAPLKYSGLAPWEIFVSESQERMVLAVAPDDVGAVTEICRLYNVEATDLGAFEPTGRLVVRYEGDVVGDLDMGFLHDGWPRRDQIATFAPRPGPEELPEPPGSVEDWRRVAQAVIGHPNVASKEPIVRQYDHTVQGTAVIGPYHGPEGDAASDAAVLRPLLDRPYGLVIAHGLNPVLNTFDPYWGALWAAAEALANLVAVGGNPREVGLIDNFIWPFPDAASLGALDRAMEGCTDVMRAVGRPFISGKDSLSSTYRFPDGRVLEIPPVLCVSAFGRIEDVERTTTSAFKRPESDLLLVGARDADAMGGSAYLDTFGLRGHRPPHVDLAALPATLDAVYARIRAGDVLACHDVSEGGLFAAVVEMGIGGDLGAEIDIAGLGPRADLALFNETAGTFVLEVADAKAIGAALGGVPHARIGRTIPDPVVRVLAGGEPLFDAALADLQSAWEAPMRAVFH